MLFQVAGMQFNGADNVAVVRCSVGPVSLGVSLSWATVSAAITLCGNIISWLDSSQIA